MHAKLSFLLRKICALPYALIAAGAICVAPVNAQTFQYPTSSEAADLRAAHFSRRAVESYLWGVPALGLAGMIDGAKRLGVAPLQMFIFDRTLGTNQHLLTPNADIIYGFAYYDLRDGPVVLDLPPAKFVGSLLDAWQRPIEDFGATGRDQGKGAKYLIVPPHYAGKLPAGDWIVLNSETNSGLLFLRAFYQTPKDRKNAVGELERVRLFAANADRAKEPFLVGRRDYNGLPPSGLAAFERLSQIVAGEPAQERDSAALGQLASIGIAPGKKFDPSESDRQSLTKAADQARQIAANMSYNPTGAGAQPIFPGTQWIRGTAMKRFDQRDGVTTQIDERAQLFTFGFSAPRSLSPGIVPAPGKGAAYAITYRSGNGSFLDGGKNYELVVPPNVPAQSYWSLTAYDAEHFDLVAAPSARPNISSMMAPARQADGSTVLRLSPKMNGSNLIQTVPGRGYFLIFRLFGPTKPFLDGAWTLPDIKEVQVRN